MQGETCIIIITIIIIIINSNNNNNNNNNDFLPSPPSGGGDGGVDTWAGRAKLEELNLTNRKYEVRRPLLHLALHSTLYMNLLPFPSFP